MLRFVRGSRVPGSHRSGRPRENIDACLDLLQNEFHIEQVSGLSVFAASRAKNEFPAVSPSEVFAVLELVEKTELLAIAASVAFYEVTRGFVSYGNKNSLWSPSRSTYRLFVAIFVNV